MYCYWLRFIPLIIVYYVWIQLLILIRVYTRIFCISKMKIWFKILCGDSRDKACITATVTRALRCSVAGCTEPTEHRRAIRNQTSWNITLREIFSKPEVLNLVCHPSPVCLYDTHPAESFLIVAPFCYTITLISICHFEKLVHAREQE